jgi:hypothetical protein
VIISPIMLVSFLVVGLVLMSIASLVILRVQARHDRLRLRIERVIGPHRRRASDNALPATSGVGLAAAAEGLGPMLAKLFGFHPALADHYVLPWWAGLIATLTVSVVSAKVANGLAGNLVWLALPAYR